MTPKTAFLQKYVVPNKTVVITTEDLDFWKGQNVVVTDALWDADKDATKTLEIPEVTILSETLQKCDNPIELLQRVKSPKIIITVPNEWSWPPEYKPHTNIAHKQQYDAELLARHLEEAGLLYTIRLIEFSGWSFLGVEATKV